jgi:hypothetical protein
MLVVGDIAASRRLGRGKTCRVDTMGISGFPIVDMPDIADIDAEFQTLD